jgi:alpha-beta hydrolase superfamily lysophospholipase
MFMLGQSMGGLVLLRYLQQHAAPRGAIVCSPWLRTAMPVPAWKLALAPLTGRLLPRLPFPHGLEPTDLTRDPLLVERYRSDPLVHGRVTPGLFRAVSRAMQDVQLQRHQLVMPLLFMLGGADRVVDTPTAETFARSLPSPDLTVRVLPGHYHELLNEPDRADTSSAILDWLLART